MSSTPLRPLSAIARDIRRAWVDKSGAPAVHYSARPYLDALSSLSSITDSYYEDSALSIVLYFLANASTFRGPAAKALKDELRSHVRSTGYKI